MLVGVGGCNSGVLFCCTLILADVFLHMGCSSIVHLNNLDNLVIACIYSVPSKKNDDAGDGLASGSSTILAAAVALFVSDVVGISMSCEKNYTICTMRSVRIFVMYTV